MPPVDAGVGNLRAAQTSFVGRREELTRALELCAGPLPLALITGPAGVGKSRLALEAAQAWLAAAAEASSSARAFAVELGSAAELEQALRRIGSALGLAFDASESAETAIERIAAALAHRSPTLLILDDADLVVGALSVATSGWLERCPGLRVLFTSRRELQGGLRHARLELAPLCEADALALLTERARRVRPDFAVSANQAEALRALVERVDALPLAIELLAPRLRLLSPSQLLARFDAVDGASKPLAQAIARSWELLSPLERDVLAQSAVFRDGFDLAAAEAVIAPGVGHDHDGAPPDVLTVLETLVAQSLLRASSSPELPDEVRIQHLRSVQEFALARLDERTGVETRHGAYFLREGERWDAGIESEAELEHTQRLIAELPNLEAAFERATAVDAVARLGLLLHLAYQRRGPFGAQAELCERVVAAARTSADGALLARGLLARARVARWHGRLDAALTDLEHARGLAAHAGDVVTEAACLRNQAACHFRRGELDAAETAITAALEAGQRSGRDSDLINAQNGLGYLWTQRGDFARAEQALERALSLARRARVPGLTALVTSSLAELMLQQERLDEAERYADETIAAYESLHYLRQLMFELLARARVRVLAGRPAARDDAERARLLSNQLGLRATLSRALSLLGQEAFFRADFGSARAWLERALDEARPEADAELCAYAGATLAALGQREKALQLFAKADALPQAGSDPASQSLLHAFTSVADSASAREAVASSARQALANGGAEARRVAGALLEHLFGAGSPAQAPTRVRLELSADARCFRIAPHASVDLTRRRALWGILRCLVARHGVQPGATVALSDVLEAGWPGERMGGESGARRVYVTVNRLRRAGLGELILTTGDGYMLAPHVEIVRGAE